MAAPRAVRIPRPRTAPTALSDGTASEAEASAADPKYELRPNVAGSQRALRLTVVFVVALSALYAAFVLYDRTAPGGTSAVTENGVLFFTVLFALFLLVGALYSLTPAPRAIEVSPDRVVVVGRWGRRRVFPPLERLSVVVVRRYPSGWLADGPVELVEVSGDDTPRRSYLVDTAVFAGARPSHPYRGAV